jgi:subtilase family serine protease
VKPAEFPAGILKQKGTIITPPVSDPKRGVHTNYKIFVPEGQKSIATAIPANNFVETPASLACIYKVGRNYAGCTPAAGPKGGGSGGWGAIALVDAFDDPNACADLAFFSSFYGLPKPNCTRVIANSSFGSLGGGFGPVLTASCSGTPANANAFGWDVEESLDIEWAHAMAPSAKIILVEACSQNLQDLAYAEIVAGIEVSKAGGGDISNSWGYPESCVGNDNCGPGANGGPYNEFQWDNAFYRYYPNNITYFASSGDTGGEVIYPSASPWVVSVGGTTVDRDASQNFQDESCWADAGGGFSTVENWASPLNIEAGLGPWSNYQYQQFGGPPCCSPFRSTPDIAADADPNSGVMVYDSDAFSPGWYIVGGTSLASPVVAAIVNASNNRLGQASSGGWYVTEENNFLYSQLDTHTGYKTNFYDVVLGNNTYAAGPGYDQCTGIGSPRGHLGK